MKLAEFRAAWREGVRKGGVEGGGGRVLEEGERWGGEGVNDSICEG
jgi:hypothetical protein